MRVSLSLVLCLVLSCRAAHAQENTTVDALSHWRRATVAVGEYVDGNFITIGSALVVTADGQNACLLTAKHVFFDPKDGWTPNSVKIRLPKETQNVDVDPGVDLQLNDVDGENWHTLDDGSDLAVIEAPNLSKYWKIDGVITSDFGKDEDIFQGANVVTLGYPMIPGPEYQISPVARGGIIAWIDPVEGASVPFLIDSNIVHGNSGGPVFRTRSGFNKAGSLTIGGGLAFIGIVSKNATEEAPVHVGSEPALRLNQQTGKVESYQATVENIGGIGIIEPVSKALRLVNQYCGSADNKSVSPPAPVGSSTPVLPVAPPSPLPPQ